MITFLHVYRKNGIDNSVIIEAETIRDWFERWESIDCKMRGYGFTHVRKVNLL